MPAMDTRTTLVCRPVESHSAGPRKPLSRGPITTSFRICAEIETPMSKRGEGCPLAIRLGIWNRHKLPQRGPGILCIFKVRKKPAGTHFSVFLSDGGAPKCRGARENFPPFTPSRRAYWFDFVSNASIMNQTHQRSIYMYSRISGSRHSIFGHVYVAM